MRFVAEEEEIPVSTVADEDAEKEYHFFRPVSEHIVTPVASQLQIQQMEAEAILGSPIFTEKTTSVSFVETLLLRLLDDLNSNRLNNEEILKLASYCMDVLQTKDLEAQRYAIIMEAAEEDIEGPYVVASSSSILAKQMVDFTLGKILDEIKSGKVSDGDMAALTATVLGAPSVDSLSGSEMDEFIEETIQTCMSGAQDSRETSLVCDALLDEYVATALKYASHPEEDRVKSPVGDAILDEFMETTLRTVRTEGSRAASPVCDALIDELVDTTLRTASKTEGSRPSSPVGDALLNEYVEATLRTASTTKGSRPSSPVGDALLNEYVGATLRTASRAQESGRHSPVCDALLDDFMVTTLKQLIKDLEEEVLSKAQIQALATTLNDEAKEILPSDSQADIQDMQDIQNVLNYILRQLQTGAMEQHFLYQIVFAIVYTYNMLRSPPTPDFENKITSLMKDVLFIVEQEVQKGNVADIDLDVVHEANQRLLQTKLDVKQIEKISSAIIGTVAKPEIICRTSTSEIARSLVENALSKAKQKLLEEEKDLSVMTGVQNVASAIITTLDEKTTTSETVSATFLDILGYLKQNIGSAKEGFTDLEEIISQVYAHELSAPQLKEMVISMAKAVSSPLKSESSLTADISVEDALQNIRDDLILGSLERDTMDQMTKCLLETYRTVKAHDENAPALLNSLVSFFKNILTHITYKVQCGEFTANDICELSDVFQARFSKRTIGPDIDELLECISRITDEIENGVLTNIDAGELGKRLIECGNKIKPLSEVVSTISTLGTDEAAETAVENVIQALQLEIDSGLLTKEILKEITKTIISASESVTRLAEEAVNYTIRGIHRDIERGFELSEIPSLSSLDHSPSVSTIAEQIVIHTIDHINQYLKEKQRSRSLIASIASSLVSLISDDEVIENLPAEFQSVKKTIGRIIQCLRKDMIIQSDAERIFSVILENYRDVVLADKKRECISTLSDSLPREDYNLVKDLIDETLKNIQRSVAAGKMRRKQFSIPSLTSDVGSSTIHAEEVVDLTLDNVKTYFLSLKSTAGSSTICAGEIVDHTLDNVKKYVSSKSLPGSSTIYAKDIVDQTLDNMTRYRSTKSIAGSSTIYANDLVDFTLDNLNMDQTLKTEFGSTTIYAYDLVNLTLENLKKDSAKKKKHIPKRESKDIVDFILEIIDTLATELSKGTVSDLSMAHFFMTISGDTSDLSILETNAQTNLRKVREDIAEKRSSSGYIQRILETYLSPDSAATELFGDPVKAVESIMISVSSEILSKFVKATLQNILVELREGNVSLPDKAPSTFILRSASSIVAESVIQEVVSRVKRDISTSVKEPLSGTLSRQEFERAASTLVGSPQVAGRISQERKASDSIHSISSNMSREVEDVVLETLHNIVSNLRLEQSMYPPNFQDGTTDSVTISNNIQEFVLDTLQNIVTDLQDKKALLELGLAKLPDEEASSAIQLQTEESCNTATYVNEVLQSVLADMKREHANKSHDSMEDRTTSKAASNLESMILDCLQNAVSEKVPQTLSYGLEPDQEDDIKSIVVESIKQTIQNIKDNNLSEAELKSLRQAMSSFQTSHKDLSITQNMISLLENVLLKTEEEGLDHQTLKRITTQLATLGMEALSSDEYETQNVLSSSEMSVNSSFVGSLVQEVLEKLKREFESDKMNSTQTVAESQENASSVPSSGSTIKQDVNYNRKVSASSRQTKNTDSAKLSDLSDICLPDNSETICDQQIISASRNFQEQKNRNLEKDKAKVNMQLKKISATIKDQKYSAKVQANVPKLSNRKEKKQPDVKPISHVENLHKVISKPKLSTNRRIARQTHNGSSKKEKPSTQSGELAKSIPSPSTKRQMPYHKHVPTGKSPVVIKKEGRPLGQFIPQEKSPAVQTQNKPENKQAAQQQLIKPKSKISSGLPPRKPSFTNTKSTKTGNVKPAAEGKSSNIVRKKSSGKGQKTSDCAPTEQSPYEIKSLCGVHKTKLTLRKSIVQSDTSGVSNSEDDHSFTSELF